MRIPPRGWRRFREKVSSYQAQAALNPAAKREDDTNGWNCKEVFIFHSTLNNKSTQIALKTLNTLKKTEGILKIQMTWKLYVILFCMYVWVHHISKIWFCNTHLPYTFGRPPSPRRILHRCGSWSRWCAHWWMFWCRTAPRPGGSPHGGWRPLQLPPSSAWCSPLIRNNPGQGNKGRNRCQFHHCNKINLVIKGANCWIFLVS